jgi:hypothetical protein
MSKKAFFRRVALAVVSALGVATFASAPTTFAVNSVGDATLTLSAASASIAVGETASVTVTTTFTSDAGFGGIVADSAIIYLAGTGFGGNVIVRPVNDTANAVTAVSGATTIKTGIGTGWNGTTGAISNGVGNGAESSLSFTAATGISWRGDSVNAVTGGAYTKAAYTYIFTGSTAVPGTYIYTFSLRDKVGTYIAKSATFTLTVTAASSAASAATSKMFLHNTAYTAGSWSPRSDSTIVANAWDAGNPQPVGYLVPEFANTAAETANATTGAQVNDSILVTVSGPGLLRMIGTGLANRSPSDSTLAKAKYVSLGETLVVLSDGTAGVGTFTASIGGVVLTQAAKTITFVGKPATFTVTSDSPQVSTAATAYQAISFVAKDSAGNAINGTNVFKNTGTPGGFYALVSDTKVVGGTAVKNTETASYTACAYNSVRLRWFCDLPITDSGTATITIADSLLASNSVVTATASINVVGAAWTGTMAWDKASYAPGEKMILTLTAKDSGGRAVVNGAANPFGQMSWSKQATFVASTGSDAAGGTFTSLETYVSGSTTYVSGTDTAVVYAPNTAGTYTLTTTTRAAGAGTATETLTLTFKVVDAAADATNAAIAASQAAADAATDAALEAIDAANAATDAANLAAEAADAATVAAEEARDAADAATAAVEALATEVATLMSALKAQISTLARTVAKIAKKVNA